MNYRLSIVTSSQWIDINNTIFTFDYYHKSQRLLDRPCHRHTSL